ncbi:unnamed protein product [Oppiella nova]|uniref:Uncharacterized protein n=1 Tax=Oppiella nova TaxID=334625 RepID=A0A7R9M6E2_9ACAR|nr:unnamed protein product [Oppiella nova]CAG2171632.1 unnamed protein product [Oppiella nova]
MSGRPLPGQRRQQFRDFFVTLDQHFGDGCGYTEVAVDLHRRVYYVRVFLASLSRAFKAERHSNRPLPHIPERGQRISTPTGACNGTYTMDEIENELKVVKIDVNNELAKLDREGRTAEGLELIAYMESINGLIEAIEMSKPPPPPDTQNMTCRVKHGVAVEIARLEG